VTRQEIKDRSGYMYGFIEEEAGKRLTIKDRSGRPYGFYDVRNNSTHEMNGRMVGYGNILTTLLPMNKK